MRQLTFRTTGFFVEDVPATLDFYRRAFGMKERYVHPSQGYGELETGDTLLTFVGRQFIEDTDLLGGARVVFPRSGAAAAESAAAEGQSGGPSRRHGRRQADPVRGPLELLHDGPHRQLRELVEG